MSKLRNPNPPPVTCTSGQLGSSMTAPALAASAPLRKVGPRFTVTEANLSIQSVKGTICHVTTECNVHDKIIYTSHVSNINNMYAGRYLLVSTGISATDVKDGK